MVTTMMTVFWNRVKKGVQEDLLKFRTGFLSIRPFLRDWWQAILASLVGASIAQTLLPSHPLLFVAVTLVVTTAILAFTSGLFSIKRCK